MESGTKTAGRITFAATEPGSVIFDGVTCEGKAALVLRGAGATVDGIVFQNMRVPDGNGAGIRLEKSDLTVTNSMFRASEEGAGGEGCGATDWQKGTGVRPRLAPPGPPFAALRRGGFARGCAKMNDRAPLSLGPPSPSGLPPERSEGGMRGGQDVGKPRSIHPEPPDNPLTPFSLQKSMASP